MTKQEHTKECTHKHVSYLNLNEPMHKPGESEDGCELYPDFYLIIYWKMICDVQVVIFGSLYSISYSHSNWRQLKIILF